MMDVVIKRKKVRANYYNTMASFNIYKIKSGVSNSYDERRKIYPEKHL